MGNGDNGCPFCEIVKGNLDSHVIRETEHSLAFLDVNPVSRGHALVVPKQHAERITDLDDEAVADVFETARDVARAADEGLEPEGINVLQSNGEAAGQEIHHMHVHVIPRYRGDGLSFSFNPTDLEEGEAHEVLDAVRSRL